MKSFYSSILVWVFVAIFPAVQAQQKAELAIPTRGFCISAPKPASVDRFVKKNWLRAR
jgi:hypothetical protein